MDDIELADYCFDFSDWLDGKNIYSARLEFSGLEGVANIEVGPKRVIFWLTRPGTRTGTARCTVATKGGRVRVATMRVRNGLVVVR